MTFYSNARSSVNAGQLQPVLKRRAVLRTGVVMAVITSTMDNITPPKRTEISREVWEKIYMQFKLPILAK